jgi:hypothetical protein
MFDAAYFRERLPLDVRDLSQTARGHEPCVKVHLHGGAAFTVVRIVEIGPGWVVFDSYRKKHQEQPEIRGRVTFAYNAISHVSITLKPTRGVGFQVDDAATAARA